VPALVEPTPLAVPAPDAAVTFARPGPPPRRSRTPLLVAIVCALFGFAAGVTMSRIRAAPAAVTTPAPTSTSTPIPPPAPAALPTPAATPIPPQRAGPAPTLKATPRPAPAKRAKADPAARPGGTGILSVIAPLEAEVLLDGKAIGKGILRREIPAGAHRIEVRYGGQKVSERFTVARGETWTYEVSPTSD
jgi:hypothetical protein